MEQPSSAQLEQGAGSNRQDIQSIDGGGRGVDNVLAPIQH